MEKSSTAQIAHHENASANGPANDSIDHLIQTYGDLLFDLCESVLGASTTTQIAFKTIIKKIRAEKKKTFYTAYERGWVLKITVHKLLEYSQEGGRSPSSSETLMTRTSDTATAPLIENFNIHFHRLPAEDQVLLLLKDKFGIPDAEISLAMSIPIGSLKIRRLQALRTLEDWLWTS